MIKRIITVFFYIVALLPAFGQEAEALNLSLKDAMLRARKNSVDAEVALNQLKLSLLQGGASSRGVAQCFCAVISQAI